jgi:hypothetical protein
MKITQRIELLAIILSVCLFSESFNAMGQTSTTTPYAFGPAPKHINRNIQPNIKPFAKERGNFSDPVVFDSPIAEQLWKEIIAHNNVDASGEYAKELKGGGSFSALSENCYLVTFDAVFYICPNRKIFEQLTPAIASGVGETTISKFWKLPNDSSWALIEGGGLRHGIFFSWFTAIVVRHNKNGDPTIQTTPLVSAQQNSDDPDSEMLCGDEQDRKQNGFSESDASRIISHQVKKSASGYTDRISFTLLRQNCKTLRRTNEIKTFIFSGLDFTEAL